MQFSQKHWGGVVCLSLAASVRVFCQEPAQSATPTVAVTFTRPPNVPPQSLEFAHGKPANPADYPATFVAVIGKSADGDPQYCTATVVGEHVFLTAAHCIPPSMSVQLVDAKNTAAEFACSFANDWVAKDLDIAVCVTESSLTPPFESILDDASQVTTNAKVLLAGFGCTFEDKTAQPGPAPPVLNEVWSAFSKVSETQAQLKSGTGACPGDSGSPVFLVLKGNKRTPRVQAGVVSRGNAVAWSAVTPLYGSEALKLVRDVAGTSVCFTSKHDASCQVWK